MRLRTVTPDWLFLAVVSTLASARVDTLADRGYPSVAYFEAVRAQGRFFIVRLTRSYDPWVCAALVEGERTAVPTRLRVSRFLAQHAGRRVDLDVAFTCGALVTALRIGAGLLGALRRGPAYLRANAQRAHPARDRRTGRLRAGLALVEPASVITYESRLSSRRALWKFMGLLPPGQHQMLKVMPTGAAVVFEDGMAGFARSQSRTAIGSWPASSVPMASAR